MRFFLGVVSKIVSVGRGLASLGLLVMVSACFMPEAIVKSDEGAQNLVSEGVLDSGFIGDQNQVHYVVRESNETALVVFIHGTPGDWKIFSPQLASDKLLEHATLVAIDRPGWGKSDLADRPPAVTLSQQSALLGPALSALKNQFNSDTVYVVGHSLGGSLAARLAMDFAGLVDAVIVLAGDLTDAYPATRWYNSVASWKALAWLVPYEMKTANEEVLALEPELSKMKDKWHNLNFPILVVQGGADRLVDPRNADFADSLKTESVVKVVRKEGLGHLFHLTHAEEVNQLLASVIANGNDFFKTK